VLLATSDGRLRLVKEARGRDRVHAAGPARDNVFIARSAGRDGLNHLAPGRQAGTVETAEVSFTGP
jgi:hypothetical protein